MSFTFAIFSSDPGLLGTAAAPFRAALAVAAGAPYGWGLAHRQSGQFLLRKQPQCIRETLDFQALLSQIRSTLAIGHVRASAEGGQLPQNTQPFRYKSWVACHNWIGERPLQIREALLATVPDYLTQSIRGHTVSECLFYVFLAYLSESTHLNDAQVTPESAATALDATIAYVDHICRGIGQSTPGFVFLLSNGQLVVAAQRGARMALVRHSSYRQVIDPLSSNGPTSFPHLKAVALFAGTFTEVAGCEYIEAGTTIVIRRDLDIQLFPQVASAS